MLTCLFTSMPSIRNRSPFPFVTMSHATIKFSNRRCRLASASVVLKCWSKMYISCCNAMNTFPRSSAHIAFIGELKESKGDDDVEKSGYTAVISPIVVVAVAYSRVPLGRTVMSVRSDIPDFTVFIISWFLVSLKDV